MPAPEIRAQHWHACCRLKGAPWTGGSQNVDGKGRVCVLELKASWQPGQGLGWEQGGPGASFPSLHQVPAWSSEKVHNPLFEPGLPPCYEGLFVSASLQQWRNAEHTPGKKKTGFPRSGSASIPDGPDAPRCWTVSQPSPQTAFQGGSGRWGQSLVLIGAQQQLPVSSSERQPARCFQSVSSRVFPKGSSPGTDAS